MNSTKIYTDLLKAVEKDKTVYVNYGIDEENVYLFLDQYRIFKFKKANFLIDLEKALPNKTPIQNCNRFFDDESKAVAQRTKDLKQIDKATVVKIANESGCAWINEKFLKEFDKEATFKIGKPHEPVQVIEQGEVVGIVLPVNMNE